MTDIARLQAQVRRLSDLEEIRTLRHRYAYLANIVNGVPGDPEAFAALFTQDGTLDFGMGLATGPAEIAAMLSSAVIEWQSAMHFMLNPLIELDGDSASGQVSGLFAFTSPTDSRPIWLCNLYRDTYQRTGEGWRFSSVRVETAFADPAFVEAYAALLQSVQR